MSDRQCWCGIPHEFMEFDYDGNPYDMRDFEDQDDQDEEQQEEEEQ